MASWKSKVLPKIRKVFGMEKNGKKAEAIEACKTFDDSKEVINKECEEKKAELQPKVTEIYEASSVEIKTLVKERTTAKVKKHSVVVTKFLEELVKIDFPGSKPACEAATKFGPVLVSGPVLFVFEKVSTFIVTEEAPAAEPAAAPAAEEGTSKEKEVEKVAEEETKEKEIEKVEEEKTPPPCAGEPAPAEAPAAVPEAAEPAKVEEDPKA